MAGLGGRRPLARNWPLCSVAMTVHRCTWTATGASVCGSALPPTAGPTAVGCASPRPLPAPAWAVRSCPASARRWWWTSSTATSAAPS
ncbi:hypothetical protein G6F61_015034 [Rhizopus arrhizus]|nr:hypothetical protein G6F61_015034 [Rhizopus arrhizus]